MIKPVIIFGLLFLLINSSIVGQDWRLSAGYNFKNFGLNYIPNDTYPYDIDGVSKGMVEIELERYLLYRLYFAGKTEFLIHDQQDVFIGGPVDFNQVNLGATVGLQWPKFGVFGGVKTGKIWDITMRSTDQNNKPIWTETTGGENNITGAFTVGIKYYLLNFVRLQATVNHTYNAPTSIMPQRSFNENPAFRSFDFSPVSFSVGISIGIPWSRSKGRGSKPDRDLPPLVRSSSVSFSEPLGNTFVTSAFGPRWRSEHQGVDLKANLRDKIVAAESGVVVKAGTGRGYGKMVRIKHGNGYETVYAHMSKISVKEGDTVKKGQEVGRAGNTGTSTGVHLHFEIIKNGTHINPESYIRF
ncbi:M23 family metallopeptidase [Gracilimonas sp. Q87]|uniref:M23 family metallopeptidase n=1 Tax=Gracilimonas sp. Q87 TaxID=3384766 RepID=UPI003984243F